VYQIICKEAKQNSKTGHVEITVHAVRQDKDGVNIVGPERTYGIEADSLQGLHGGDLSKWLASVKEQHRKWAGMHEDLTTDLLKLKGKEL
jgi:hypothetical protein